MTKKTRKDATIHIQANKQKIHKWKIHYNMAFHLLSVFSVVTTITVYCHHDHLHAPPPSNLLSSTSTTARNIHEFRTFGSHWVYFIKWKFVDFWLCVWHMASIQFYLHISANEKWREFFSGWNNEWSEVDEMKVWEKREIVVIIIQCPLAINRIKLVSGLEHWAFESIVIRWESERKEKMKKMSWIPFCFGLPYTDSSLR